MKMTKIFWMVCGIVVACAVFIGGFGVGVNYSSGGKSTGGASYGKGFADGMQNAKDLLSQSNIFPPEPETVANISGKVTAKDSQQLTILANPLSLNPLADQGPKTRTISVNDKTTVVALINKNSQEVNADFKAYQEAMKKNPSTKPPLPYKEVPAALEDIKLTMVVTVAGAGDLRDMTTIDATKISFQTF